jgi:cell fate regulator YaaT (PSP1 superfamily)
LNGKNKKVLYILWHSIMTCTGKLRAGNCNVKLADAEFPFDKMHEAFEYTDKKAASVRKVIISME